MLYKPVLRSVCCFFFQAEDGIRDWSVTGVQTCALPIYFESCPRHFQQTFSREPSQRELSQFRRYGAGQHDRGLLQGCARSEERRVGKECRCGRSRESENKAQVNE